MANDKKKCPLSGLVTGQMLQMQNDIKQDSGQNQFTRGETIGGVTAASAIASLQEAGGKITRLRTGMLNEGFARMVEQIIWLVAEFYEPGRARRITGRDGESHEMISRCGGDFFPPPPYSVRVEVQRRNPLRVQARNELYMQAYTMAAQCGQPLPLSTLFELLDADGKERALAMIKHSEEVQAAKGEPQAQRKQEQGDK